MNNPINYLPILIVVIIYVARMIEIWTKRDLIPGEIKESNTLKLFKLVGLFAVASGITEFLVFKKLPVWGLVGIGILFSVSSFYIRNKAIKALGKFWSLHVEIRENHQFVKSGPFQIVRHPAYTSMIMEILAVGLVLAAPISTVLALLFFIPVLNKRIKVEERELVSKFGEDYSNYIKTTPALIPFKF